jgi:hypothetical protein
MRSNAGQLIPTQRFKRLSEAEFAELVFDGRLPQAGDTDEPA